MEFLAALARATKYIMTGEDSVITEQMHEIVAQENSTDLSREWENVRIEYGANRIDPHRLSPKMLEIYMQCKTLYVSDKGKSQESSFTTTHTQREKITRRSWDDYE